MGLLGQFYPYILAGGAAAMALLGLYFKGKSEGKAVERANQERADAQITAVQAKNEQALRDAGADAARKQLRDDAK